MEKKVKKIRKINYQKLFNFASFIFILVCIFWYGGRFIYFYLENHKSLEETETLVLATELKNKNFDSENFKQIKNDYYFYGEATNNYVSYSNHLWRIVKINKDNSILLISNSIIGTLAYGDTTTNYEDSNLIKWLNDESKGKFINALQTPEKYLIKTSTCIDNVDDIENINCKEINNNNYLGMLSLKDYLNAGGNKSFINNQKYNYLANKNNNNEIWYITNEGKIDTSDGEEILGIKATITLNPTITLKDGNGTIENPYTFEETTNLIGSYVKLDNDTWRIYEENEGIIKLVLDDTIKEENNTFKHSYSNNNYYHNDTTYGSLAYYLNKTYYNSLNYKDLIIENTYVNGLYGTDNNYNYQEISTKTIETKVSIPSIDDIIFNDNLNEYFTNTGKTDNQEAIYIRKNNGYTSPKRIVTENQIVPCISIKRENLTQGTGSKTEPYRMEQ